MIRVTNRGKFQVIEDEKRVDLSRAKCFATREEAEAYENRPTPEWVLRQQQEYRDQQPYVELYTSVLASPRMRELRRNIQEAYGEMCEAGHRAAAAQRAAIRGFGQISCIGRDIGHVRQSEADRQGDEVDELFAVWHAADRLYERELQAAMAEEGIPIAMFRTPLAK